ncbi:MAG: hypothetical protein DDT31_00335 [Syntrophomonadaceae bacterium]|nr:hypothetical protein [Bacillota bacterium]
MENFTDLKFLYDHLEKNAVDYKYSHQIENLFKKLRDLKHQKNNKNNGVRSPHLTYKTES